MRNILNLIITFAIFYVGDKYFTDYIHFSDMKTMILSTALMFVIGWIFGRLLLLSFLLIPVGIGCLTSVLLILMAFVLTPIKLALIDTYVPGAEINGFWTYVIITVALSVFTIKSKSSDTTTESK
jgi:uncharacterized membrane protein YvlD (DUF360 family)